VAKGAVKLFTLDCANKEEEKETGEVDDAEDEADEIDDESEHEEIRLHTLFTLLAMISEFSSLECSSEGNIETGIRCDVGLATCLVSMIATDFVAKSVRSVFV
jgi:hypothetical protein